MSLWSEEYTTPPVRVIMAEGRFTEHATDEHRAKVEAVKALAPDPAPRLRISEHPALRQPPARRVERPAVCPQPVRTRKPLAYAGAADRMVAMYRNGHDVRTIAEATKRGKRAVYAALSKAGIVLPNSPKSREPRIVICPVEPATALQIAERFLAGESQTRLAAAFGLTRKRVRTLLRSESRRDPAITKAMNESADRVKGNATHCTLGHLMTADNVRLAPRGRVCLTCWRKSDADRKRKREAEYRPKEARFPREQMIAMVAEGKTTHEIANALGCHVFTVRRKLAEGGCGRDKRMETVRARIVELRAKGLYIKAIGAEVRVSASFVIRTLKAKREEAA